MIHRLAASTGKLFESPPAWDRTRDHRLKRGAALPTELRAAACGNQSWLGKYWSEVRDKREPPAFVGKRFSNDFAVLGNDFHGSVQNRPPAETIEFLLVDDGIDARWELDRSVFIVNDRGKPGREIDEI